MEVLNSQINLLDHSKAKVTLLGKYLHRYLSILCHLDYIDQISIYDLFSGPGVYENGGKGSPIIILEAVKKISEEIIQKKNTQIKINCTFNDNNKDKIKSLLSNIEELELNNPEIYNIQTDTLNYHDKINQIIYLNNQQLYNRNNKSFIFIDPYGYKHIRIDELKKLMSIRGTEILLWLPIQFMYRFKAEENVEVLMSIFKQLNIEEEVFSCTKVNKFTQIIRDGFQDYMGDNFYVDYFRLHKDKSTLFAMFFFTSNLKGVEKMVETKWEIDQNYGKSWSSNNNQNDLFRDQQFIDLADSLEEYIKTGKRNNYDLYKFTLKNEYLPTHTTKILKQWQKEEKLEVLLTKDNKKARNGSFYIKYHKDYDDQNKVYFQFIK